MIQRLLERPVEWGQQLHRASPFGSRVLLTAGTNVFLAAIGLATGILAARLLGPQGRGELAAIQLWPSLLATLAMLGLPEALVYYSAREPVRAGRYLGSAVSLGLLAAGPVMLVGFLLMPVLLAAQPEAVIRAARWYLLIVPLYALVGMPIHPLRGVNDFLTWNLLRPSANFCWLLVLAAAFLLERSTPQWVAAWYLVALALLMIPIAAIVRRRIAGPFAPGASQWSPLLRFGLPTVAGTLPQLLNLRVDQLLMAALLPARSLGLYVVAVAWSGIISQVPSAVGAVLFPRVASQPEAARQAEAFAQGSRLGVALVVLLAVPLALLTPWLLPLLFGARFAESVPAALILVAAGSLAGLNGILQEGLKGLGHPKAVMWSEFAGVGATATALFLLLRPLGIVGAALASLAGSATVAAFLLIQARRIARVSLSSLLLPRGREFAATWRRIRSVAEETASAPPQGR